MATTKPEQTIEALFGHTEKLCLEMFAESIKEAHRNGANKWGVTLYNKDRVRLNVGSIVVCTLHAGGVWFALDRDKLESPEYAFVKESSDWKSTPQYDYVAVPSMSGLYKPSTARVHAKTWAKIRKMHFALIDKAATKYTKLRSSSRNVHSKDFLEYLRENLHDSKIPNPK